MSREGFTNAVVGGAETLIRSAIKSVNYVLGVSGWRITRDGDAEFNDATIRGTVIAGNGTVVLNNLGVYVTDDNSVQQYVILRDGGFLARNSPDDGEHTQMYVLGLAISLPTTSTHGFASTDSRFDATEVVNGAVDFIQANVVTGTINGQSDANLLLRSEGSNGVTQPFAQIDVTATGTIQLTSGITFVDHRLVSVDTGMDYAASQLFSVNMTIAADASLAVVATHNYPVAFPAGSTLFGYADINSGSGSMQQMHCRWVHISVTQCQIICYRPAGVAASGGFVFPVNIAVFIVPN